MLIPVPRSAAIAGVLFCFGLAVVELFMGFPGNALACACVGALQLLFVLAGDYDSRHK